MHLVVHHSLCLEKLLPDTKRQQTAVEQARHPRMVLLELLRGPGPRGRQIPGDVERKVGWQAADLYSGYVRHRALQ